MKIDGKNCLVTGGAGFVGSHLVEALLARDCKVTVFDNFATGKEANLARAGENRALTVRTGSVLDKEAVKAATKNADLIFHLACLGVRHSLLEPFENHRVNAEGTLNVLQVALESSAHVLYCSSSEIYGTAEHVPMSEDHPTRPCTVYGASKLAGESYARAYFNTYGLPVVIVRPFNIFGPRSHHEGSCGELIPKSIVRCLGGKPIILFGDGNITRDFTFIGDTVEGIISAMESDGCISQTLNIGSGHEISIRHIAEAIIRKIKTPGVTIDFQAERPGDVKRLFSDYGRFSRLTGWRPKVSFDAGLETTIEYFKSHPQGISKLLADEQGRNWERV